VFSGKEQLAAVRSLGEVLVMGMLNYAPEIREAASLGVGEPSKVTSQNLRLAKELIRSLTADKFSIGDYEDRYRRRVKEQIAAKRKGKEIVAPEDEAEPEVINLMEALKQSVSKSRKQSGRRTARSRRKKAI
jgi:DNA end-binding protein Ku